MKDLTPSMAAHLKQGVTTICTCMDILRNDGKSFRFTDHDQPLTVANAEYIPYSSFARTSIATGTDLEVDQMEVKGALNSMHVSRDDVAAGLFDFAQVRVFVVNYTDPDSGSVTLRTGWLGEVTMNEDGTYTAELRGLTQVYTYRIGQAYQPECRADLGDSKCKIAINPARWRASYIYQKGDVVLGLVNAATGYTNLNITNAGFDDDGAISKVRNLTGWTSYGDPNGRWTAAASNWFGINGHDSFAAFGTDNGNDADLVAAPHTVSDIGMYQDCDLVGQGVSATDLDTGLCRLHTSIWYACVNGQEAGAQYRVYALDGSGNQIGVLYDTGLQKTAEDRWFQAVGDNIIIPTGTRKLRFDVFAHKRYSFTEGAGFDTLTAAVNSPSGTLGGADQYGGVAFKATVNGTSGTTEPTWDNLIDATTMDNGIVWQAVKSWKTETTVTGASNGGRTIVPTAVTDVDGYYDGGLLTWETGLNAGRSQEIKAWAGGSLSLFERPFNLPVVGDRFVIHPGCDKTRATCQSKFANILNFRGEPDVPGQDAYYTTPNAPQS